MLSADGNKPVGKSGQRKRKAEPRKKAGEQQVAKPEQLPDQLQDAQHPISEEINEPISTSIASTDIAPTDTAVTVASEVVPVAAADVVPVGLQTIANAYGDYARKSLEQTWAFFGKLAGVRSPDKALELQTEFAKQAYDTFLAESQKILELHGQLARQRVIYLEGFVIRMTETTLVLRATRN
jgi:hypothetical protein